MSISDIKINEYIYELDEKRIAKYPLQNRDDSKLLIYKKGDISHDSFHKIHKINDIEGLFVFNNTKVIQARLNFRKKTGANIEIFCLEPFDPTDYNLMFQSEGSCIWKCVIGNLKKWKEGELINKLYKGDKEIELHAEKLSSDADSHLIKFSWDDEISFGEILELSGKIPIPPYLKRDSEESDKQRYQTIYSIHKGSVAAPTAGLHFTENVLSELQKKGIKNSFITLHVGAGTFKPVKEQNISDHEMHTEHFSVNKKLINDLIKNLNNVTVVGTTSVRTLESLYYIGLKLESTPNLKSFHIDQWEVFKLKSSISVKKSFLNILKFMNTNRIEELHATTKIMIVPGYKFKVINKLITNFHQPKSTLLLLIAAFIGEDWKRVYSYALENGFRFLSYGDSSILIP